MAVLGKGPGVGDLLLGPERLDLGEFALQRCRVLRDGIVVLRGNMASETHRACRSRGRSHQRLKLCCGLLIGNEVDTEGQNRGSEQQNKSSTHEIVLLYELLAKPHDAQRKN